MTAHDATEQAYKNGYAQGRKDALDNAVEVVRCKDCKHDNVTTCPLCWIENHTLQFVNHNPEFYCGAGERREA